VLFGVLEMGVRGRRWKGESIVNSSWMVSVDGGTKGERWSRVYSDISIV
jgi:hypothetical protein